MQLHQRRGFLGSDLPWSPHHQKCCFLRMKVFSQGYPSATNQNKPSRITTKFHFVSTKQNNNVFMHGQEKRSPFGAYKEEEMSGLVQSVSGDDRDVMVLAVPVVHVQFTMFSLIFTQLFAAFFFFKYGNYWRKWEIESGN